MGKNTVVAAVLLLSGCTVVHPVSRGATLILKPQVLAGSHTQTLLNPYDRASINHLKLEVFPLAAGVPQAKVAGQILLNAQLDNPVVFSNLKANTQYRIQASAYYAADDTQLISVPASSSVDISVVSDDRPTLGALKVQLMDRLFNGQASSSLNIISGGYSAISSESSLISPSISGYVSTLSGVENDHRYQDGSGIAVRFAYIQGMLVADDGTLYVADDGNHCIRKISQSGVVTTLAGSPSAGIKEGTGSAARFHGPMGLVLDKNTGDLYVSDYYGAAIQKVTSSGVVTIFAGNGTAGFSDGVGLNARFDHPGAMVLDNSGNLFVVDSMNNSIRRIVTSTGAVTTFAGNGTTGHVDAQGANARFYQPLGLTSDSSGNLYVAEFGGFCIRKVTPTANVSTLAGVYTTSGTTDGSASSALFDHPHGVALDAYGNLYITDYGNKRIRKLTPSGIVSTFAGGGPDGVNGFGTQAGFLGVRHPYIAPDGTLYVGDEACIRRIQ